MQFLLLLSALLSAVTGAFAGARPVAEPVSMAEAQIPAPAASERSIAAEPMPAQVLPALAGERPRETGDALRADAPLTDIRFNE